MATTTTTVHVEHSQIVHWVRTSSVPRSGQNAAQASAGSDRSRAASTPGSYTLLELVEAIADVTEDDREIVATVIHLLASGQVRLCGNFRDEPIELFLAS